MPRKDLRPEDIVVLRDTREQRPLDLKPLRTQRATLATGDYSVLGLQHCVAIERKSLSDLLGCIGNDRERFEREIQRLLGYETRALIVESTWTDIEAGWDRTMASPWRSKVTPQSAMGSLIGWLARGIPVVLAGDRAMAAQMVGRLCFTAARRRWREMTFFQETLRLESKPSGEKPEVSICIDSNKDV